MRLKVRLSREDSYDYDILCMLNIWHIGYIFSHHTHGYMLHFYFLQEVQKHSVHTLVFRSLKRTHDMFIADQGSLPEQDLNRLVIDIVLRHTSTNSFFIHMTWLVIKQSSSCWHCS